MRQIPKRVAIGAGLAAIGALALPSAASATVNSTVDQAQHRLTITSDDAADSIVLAVVDGVFTVNGQATATPLTADENAQIVVEAGNAPDTVDASALGAANYGSLVIDGGGGDDLLTGGADADTLRGGTGNDRLTAFKNTVAGTRDIVSGDSGDDVMVWNNGDGSDVDDGDEGTDEVEVNGSPSVTNRDGFAYKPDPDNPGRVQFDRLNLVPFGINFTAERLTVNGLGGNDISTPDVDGPAGLAGLTSLTLNGGPGNDQLFGADGADQINGGGGLDVLLGAEGADLIRGGDDGDLLSGEGGDDRLIGDRGADSHFGDDGDDVIVWNNGDGTDQASGDPGFDRLEVNGSATGDDMFLLSPINPDALFERINLVPFSIDLTSAAGEPNGGIETVAVNGGGGNDRLGVEPGLPGLPVVADGDAGNDALVGGDEADSFFGGSGDDTLVPGLGSDLADGETGDDHLLARDGVGDLVRGGPDTDTAETDPLTVDVVSGVESLVATPAQPPGPAPDTRALPPTLGKVAVVRTGGHLLARLPVYCPAADAGGCHATVRIETAKVVRRAGMRRVRVLGSKNVDLGPGQQSTVSIRLDGAAALARHGRLAARVRIASTDSVGNSTADSRVITLRIPRG
jgi:Ca2+-binding RTX toxin-like protein